MASSVSQQEEWYEHLLRISRQAAEQRAFEVAYHTLAVALHCVNDLQQERALFEKLQALSESYNAIMLALAKRLEKAQKTVV